MKIIISSNVKLVKSASGNKVIKLSKSTWEEIGVKSGWLHCEAMLEAIPMTCKVNTFVRQNQDRTSSNNNDFPRDPNREFNPNADISNVQAVSSLIKSMIIQMNNMVSNYKNKGYFLTDSTKNCRNYLDKIAKEYVMTPFDINFYYRYTEKIDRNINKPDFVLQLVDAMVSGLENTINECEKFKKSKNSKRQ